MSKIAIIYPNQLFELKYLPYDYQEIDNFIITEDPIYFSDKERQLNFNMLKLIYQRASMKYYQSYLKEHGLKTTYLDWNERPDYLFKYIRQKNPNAILYIIDPVDHLLQTRMRSFSQKNGLILKFFDTPAFLTSSKDLEKYNSLIKPKKRYYQYNFYIWQRKRQNILMKEGKPIGGSYSYDKENRKRLPTTFKKFINDNKIKNPVKKYDNRFYSPAILYCEEKFINYYPESYQPENIYLYPITHADSKSHFSSFLKNKLKYFGVYEDAIDFNEPYMFHSVISPQLNNGLIIPNWIIKELLKSYKKKLLYAIEGYIRQLNWREYSRLLYIYAYDRMKKNYFGNKNRLTTKWYTGETGIIPIDLTIKSAFNYGYLHHIMRLMIMCNFFNLCSVNPDDVYKWFMEFSLDSYDWVMINNVYSMGLYADGGLTTTKPYISSDAYIRKMAIVPKKESEMEWKSVWRILYYNFIQRNYDKLTGRGKIYQGQWTRLKQLEKNRIISLGKKILRKLFS